MIPASSAGNCSSQTDFGGNEDEDFFRPSLAPTDFSEIPAKEIIIVILMLSLWVYSIILTRRAWYQFLKEWWNKFYVPNDFKKSTISLTHFGFTNIGSEVLSFRVIALRKGQFCLGYPVLIQYLTCFYLTLLQSKKLRFEFVIRYCWQQNTSICFQLFVMDLN